MGRIHFIHSSGVAIALVMYAVWLLPDAWQDLLQYELTGLRNGELWRVLTGNFTHFSLYHVTMNALGVLAIAFFLWPRSKPYLFGFAIIFIPICVSVGLWLFTPEIGIYRGYSGALYGVLVLGLLVGIRQEPLWLGVGLAILAVKIGFEQTPWYDADTFTSQIGAPVATAAHLYGVIAGTGIFALLSLRGRHWY